MVVYADVIFVTNLLLDGAVLMTTAWTRRIRTPLWKIACAAVIGASYVVLMFLPELSFMFTFMMKCIFSILMIMTAFGFGSLQNFLRNLAAFYAVNFAAGGGIFGLHYFLQSNHELLGGIMQTLTGSTAPGYVPGALFLTAAFVGSIVLYRNVQSRTREKDQLGSFMAEVMIRIGDKEVVCQGLIDTGNQLYDPLTRTPVMVMDAMYWKDDLPESWIRKIQQGDVDSIITAMGTEAFPWQDRLRLIPYRGVNRGTQFMLALKPDLVTVIQGEKRTEAGKVLIGLDGGKLSSDGSYQAIIHPALIQA